MKILILSIAALVAIQDPNKPPAPPPQPVPGQPPPPQEPAPQPPAAKPDAAKGGACDCRSVTKALYCKACAKFLESAEIIDHNFCRKCNEGKPQTQREPLERKWVCTKYYYTCAEHKRQEWFSATCGDCKKPYAKMTDRAEVKWKCSGCNKEYAESKCEAEECRKAGKELRAVCSKSGTYPHVPEQ